MAFSLHWGGATIASKSTKGEAEGHKTPILKLVQVSVREETAMLIFSSSHGHEHEEARSSVPWKDSR